MKSRNILWLLLLFLAACSNTFTSDWKTTQHPLKVVWANDNSEIVVVVQSYEEKSSVFNHPEKRNFKHQLLTQKIEGTERKPLTQWRDAQVEDIFYMKSAEYLVVSSLLENGTRRFDKINSEGHWIPIVEENQIYQPCLGKSPLQVDHQVIPSPNGEQLIEVYSPECGKATIEFLYANNLSFIDSQTFNIDKPMKVLWHPDGYVVMVSKTFDKAWQFSAQTPPLPISPPRCWSPVTSSSQVSSDGQMVYFEQDKLIVKHVGPQRIFGGCFQF